MRSRVAIIVLLVVVVAALASAAAAAPLGDHGGRPITVEMTGAEEAPGPVVVPLDAPTDGSSSGCATVDRALAKDIRQNPEDYYVNVHNAEFPAGAIRGQLG